MSIIKKCKLHNDHFSLKDLRRPTLLMCGSKHIGTAPIDLAAMCLTKTCFRTYAQVTTNKIIKKKFINR